MFFFRERDLRKLDVDREGLTDEEFQARRNKLFAERTRVLKGAYDRKMDRLKEQTGGHHLNGDQAARKFFRIDFRCVGMNSFRFRRRIRSTNSC